MKNGLSRAIALPLLSLFFFSNVLPAIALTPPDSYDVQDSSSEIIKNRYIVVFNDDVPNYSDAITSIAQSVKRAMLVSQSYGAGGKGSATSQGADDTFARFSSYGSVVDIGGPGVNVYSTCRGSAYCSMNGTSMAAPHVAGIVALYIKKTRVQNGQIYEMRFNTQANFSEQDISTHQVFTKNLLSELIGSNVGYLVCSI